MRGFLEGLVGQETVRPVDPLVPPRQAGGLSDAARPLIGLAASVTARFGGGGGCLMPLSRPRSGRCEMSITELKISPHAV